MSFIRIHIFEGYIARFAVVRGFLFSARLLLDVDCGDSDGDNGRGRDFFFGLVGGVDESCVADDVAAVGRSVGTTAAAVDPLAGGRWARRCGLPVVVFEHARYVALFLELRKWLVSGVLLLTLKRLLGVF